MPLLILAGAILLLLVLIVRFQLNAFLALLLASFMLAGALWKAPLIRFLSDPNIALLVAVLAGLYTLGLRRRLLDPKYRALGFEPSHSLVTGFSAWKREFQLAWPSGLRPPPGMVCQPVP